MWEFRLSGVEDLKEMNGRLGLDVDAIEDVSILSEPVQAGGLVIPNSLAVHPDAQLQKRLEEVIAMIAAAQSPDGYLVSHYQITKPEYEHFADELCETSFFGRMIEAAVAHYGVTGKTDCRDGAAQAADLLVEGQAGGRDGRASAHAELGLALVKLYRVTGERRYLDAAERFVQNMVKMPTRWSAGRPFLGADEATGHAVAAMYGYCGALDVAMLRGNTELPGRHTVSSGSSVRWPRE